MIKYISKSGYGAHKVTVQSDADSTTEAFELWCQFMRGCSYFIDAETEEEMLEALANQSARARKEHDVEYDRCDPEFEIDCEECETGEYASPSDALESAAEKY